MGYTAAMGAIEKQIHLLDTVYMRTPLRSWLVALAAALSVLVLLFALRRALRGRLGRLIGRIPGRLDDIAVQTLQRTSGVFICAVALYVGAQWLVMPKVLLRLSDVAMLLVTCVQAGAWAQRMVVLSVEAIHPEGTGARGTAGAAFKFLGTLLIWSVVFLLVLQNLGIQISALLAGLGVGGIAAALALQTILADLFASLSIFTDRPFDLGDFIAVDGYMGTVNKVGLRSTRLTALGGEHIVLPNGILMKTPIRNFRRMHERRVVTRIGIEYGVPYEKVRKVPGLLRSLIEAQTGLRFDRAHFAEYGSSALLFELVYYVLGSDYSQHMDLQQELLLEIMRTFEAEAIPFAFPSQTLYLRGLEASAAGSTAVPGLRTSR
jgi:small-conductance mechanosensitive channel